MYYYIISIALITLGFILLFFVDTLIKPNTDNSVLKSIRDNNTIISLFLIVIGYYTSTLCELPIKSNQVKLTEMSNVGLPTYDESMSTDAVLKM